MPPLDVIRIFCDAINLAAVIRALALSWSRYEDESNMKMRSSLELVLSEAEVMRAGSNADVLRGRHYHASYEGTTLSTSSFLSVSSATGILSAFERSIQSAHSRVRRGVEFNMQTKDARNQRHA